MQKAAEEAVKEVAALGGSGGIISIDKFGKYHGEARLGAKPVVYWPLGEK